MSDRKYDAGEFVIHWQPDECIHCNLCVVGLPSVFEPTARPWVNVRGATPAEIREQIGRCPSGALSILEIE